MKRAVLIFKEFSVDKISICTACCNFDILALF